jgi:predicted transcriptional regulator
MEAEIALRHLEVLKAVKERQPIGIFKLSEELNMPKHRVRYSLRVLEQSGIIEPTQYGAVIKDSGYEEIEKLKESIAEIKNLVEKLENTVKGF